MQIFKFVVKFDIFVDFEQDTGFDEKFQQEFSRNLARGQALFEHVKNGLIESPDMESFGGRRNIGGPGDMYLVCLHTKISSNILRNKAESIGSGASIFSVEQLIDRLVKQ